MELTETDREMLRAVKAGVVIHVTSLYGPNSYERSDGGDLDFDVLDRLAGLDLIAWRHPGVGAVSRERIDLTEDGEAAARSL